METYHSRGFTLIELLVVISIIGILASVLLAALGPARDDARVARAQAELRELNNAGMLLESNTGSYIGGDNMNGCNFDGGTNEYDLTTAAAGLVADNGEPGWRGPYFSDAPIDPWGNPYIFDEDYECVNDETGCEGYSGTVTALHSGGPNGSGINGYDADNVVLVLCVP